MKANFYGLLFTSYSNGLYLSKAIAQHLPILESNIIQHHPAEECSDDRNLCDLNLNN